MRTNAELHSSDSMSETLASAYVPGTYTHASIICLCTSTGRVLMSQRSLDVGDDPEVQGTWEFPGGGISEDETAIDGGLRELWEETGLIIPEGLVRDAYASGSWCGIVIDVPNETWANEPVMLATEVVGVGWMDVAKLIDTALVRPEIAESEDEMTEMGLMALGQMLLSTGLLHPLPGL